MKQPGTVIATRDQLDAADRWQDAQDARELALAAEELAGLERRVVCREVRYYYSATVYTPALKRSPSAPRRWFEARRDGDWPVPSPI